MVRPVEEDARGVVAPDRGLQHFQLRRHEPSPVVARFVGWYWEVTWDLPPGETYEQPVLSHPVVNLVFGDDGSALVHGPKTRIGSRVLAGSGRALGVYFRPGGYHPLLGAPVRTIVDRVFPFDAEVPADVAEIDAHLAARLPHQHQPCEDTMALVERVAAAPAMGRVDALAAEAGLSERQLQRRFAEHVGLSPKAVIRRFRLYEAAERTRHGPVDWASVAAELGYSDQSHLTRDFTRALGMPPERYARYSAMPKVSSTKASTSASSRQAS